MRPLIYNLKDIYEALVELSENSDPISRHTAESLGNSILKFDFICSLQIWYSILFKINTFSKYLQSPSICLTTAVGILQSTKQFLSDLRNDQSFQKFISESEIIAQKLNIEPSFPLASTIRSRRKPPLFSYEGRDEIISDPKKKFKVEFYYKVIVGPDL